MYLTNFDEINLIFHASGNDGETITENSKIPFKNIHVNKQNCYSNTTITIKNHGLYMILGNIYTTGTVGIYIGISIKPIGLRYNTRLIRIRRLLDNFYFLNVFNSGDEFHFYPTGGSPTLIDNEKRHSIKLFKLG